jgi:hypothetical protein
MPIQFGLHPFFIQPTFCKGQKRKGMPKNAKFRKAEEDEDLVEKGRKQRETGPTNGNTI